MYGFGIMLRKIQEYCKPSRTGPWTGSVIFLFRSLIHPIPESKNPIQPVVSIICFFELNLFLTNEFLALFLSKNEQSKNNTGVDADLHCRFILFLKLISINDGTNFQTKINELNCNSNWDENWMLQYITIQLNHN